MAVKPGTTLYLSFRNFKGYTYLASLDSTDHTAGQSRVLETQGRLMVCGDHFAVRGVYSAGEDVPGPEAGVFYI
jgi:hypothetical protein